jgi:WD40 repeat protein
VFAPQESIIRKLYESYAHPFVRVVHGAPMAWDQNAAAATYPSTIDLVVWSPCNGFIAIALKATMTVDILDSVTFQQLQTLIFPQGTSKNGRVLIFSPDSHILTCASGSYGVRDDLDQELSVISWDLQTGGVASIIRWQGPDQPLVENPSITYSANGKVAGVFCWYYKTTAIIFICDIASGVYMHSYSLDNSFPPRNDIWTHGEFLRFMTADLTSITIWEVGFISGGTPMEVKTFPAFDDSGTLESPSLHSSKWAREIQLLHTPFRLATTSGDGVLVWDAQDSKFLLCCTDAKFLPQMSFSSDGCFFACPATGAYLYLWKESPTGYALHGVLTHRARYPRPLFSPNGELIIMFGDRTIQLWHTNSFTTRPSWVSTKAWLTENYVLNFSPNGMLAVVATQGEKVVTVFNLKSGVLQLIIDAGMGVYDVKVTEDTVIVLGDWMIVTWDLPMGSCVPDTRVGPKDSSLTINLKGPHNHVYGASISPDSLHIAVIMLNPDIGRHQLYTYSASTGSNLGCADIDEDIPRFSPNGHDVWCAARSGKMSRWGVSGGDDKLELLEYAADIEHPPEGCPWGPSQGYQVTGDWWILNPDGKRLLMLPPPWQSYTMLRVWKGKFLALLHGELPEPVILEVEP